jgi:hypothetical protein
MASKRTRILIAAACVAAVLAAAAVLAGGQFFIRSHEGYFSPVFSPDRRSIYFIERRTRGIVWGLGVEHFTPPAHAYVLQDRIFLNRLDRDSGRVETLARWPSSPLVRKHMRTYRNRVFSVPSARLQFNDDGDLHYAFGLSIPKQPRSESWWLRDSVPPGVAITSPPEWQSGDKRLYGHARYVLDGDWELIHFYGEAAFPPAIVLYNAATQGIRIVKRAPAFESQFPEGIPPRLLADRSVRKNVERIDELKQTRERLLAEFRQQGLSDGDARLRTTNVLRELGYLSKPEMLTARTVGEPSPGGTVFKISRREFQVGLFQDIDRAIRAPGTPVEHSVGTYLRHTEFDTSEKLKRFLKDGGMRFYVETEDATYEMHITPSQPATR